jgi:uncharacterized membrane-anchored protein
MARSLQDWATSRKSRFLPDTALPERTALANSLNSLRILQMPTNSVFYDVSTRNLTWAIQGYTDEQGKQVSSVNHSVRVLGRRGTMNVDLVLDPSLVESAVPKFNMLLQGFSFHPGNSYSEFRAGDSFAKYGLTALVVGEATAVAAKTGLLAKLSKLIIAALAGLAALLGRAWNYLKRVMSGRASEESPKEG